MPRDPIAFCKAMNKQLRSTKVLSEIGVRQKDMYCQWSEINATAPLVITDERTYLGVQAAHSRLQIIYYRKALENYFFYRNNENQEDDYQ